MFFRVACCLPLQIMLSHGAGWLGLGLSWLGGLALHWFCLVGLGLAGLGFWASPWLPLGFPCHPLASPFPSWLSWPLLASPGPPLAHPCPPLGLPWHIFVLCPGPPCCPCLASGLVWPGVDADMQTDRQTDGQNMSTTPEHMQFCFRTEKHSAEWILLGGHPLKLERYRED